MGKVNRPPPKFKAKRLPVPDIRADLPLIMERIADRVTFAENGCTNWLGSKNELGYGTQYWRGRSWMIHRLIYAAHNGPHDPWLDIRHSCDNPGCINIDHLGIGTRSDNMRDAVDRRRSKNAKKTHCPKGHAYAEHGEEFTPNTSHYRKWRRCKICQRENHRTPEALAKARERQRMYRERAKLARESSVNGEPNGG